jgi:DNA mismatch endonuclease (patch repair protein)
MRATRQHGTAAELALRAALDRLALEYTVDVSPIPGMRRRADVVFPAERVAVLVDGCFWHGCPVHGTWPKQNAEWWREKIEANRRRDADTDRQLTEAGWMVLRIWEHDDSLESAARIQTAVGQRRHTALDDVPPVQQEPRVG